MADEILDAGKTHRADLTARDAPKAVRSRDDMLHIQQPEGLEGPTEFLVWGWVEPRENFGLPNGDAVVHPADDEWVTMHLPLQGGGTRWGTLSRYRTDDEAVREDVDLGSGIRARVEDNNVTVLLTASDAPAAGLAAIEAVERLLAHVSVSTGVPFTFHLAGLQTTAGQKVTVLRPMGNYTCTLYAIEQLRQHFREDQDFARIADPRLDRALEYYMHAQFLMNVGRTADRQSKDYFFIQSAVFLNLWKAVTAVVGDSRERDFQRRYRKLGLDFEFFKSKIEWMKRVRDDADVAHHDLEATGVRTVQDAQNEGVDVAKQVISAYRQFLLSGGTF